MRRLVMLPEGWACTFGECRPGFFMFGETLCLKDEYGSAGNAYNEAGEIFWGGVSDENDRRKLVVQPVEPVWEDYG